MLIRQQANLEISIPHIFNHKSEPKRNNRAAQARGDKLEIRAEFVKTANNVVEESVLQIRKQEGELKNRVVDLDEIKQNEIK